MNTASSSRFLDILNIAGYVIAIAVGVPLLVSVHQDQDPYRWLVTILVVAFIAALIVHDRYLESSSDTVKHVYLGLQSLLIAGIVLLQPHYYSGIILFFLLSAQATTFFDLRLGMVWVAVFVSISAGLLYLSIGGIQALISLPIYAAGYAFFAAFADQTRRAKLARDESLNLLHQLQIANVQLQNYAEQVEDFAVIAERQRLAREMHDTVGHRLTVAAVQLEAAQRLVGQDPQRAQTMIETVRDQLAQALADLRQTVAALRAPVDEDLSLTHSLQRLVSQFTQATNIQVELGLASDLPLLPPSHRRAIYRAAQESLTNVQRHANAHKALLTLDQSDGAVILIIRDDGQGVAPHQLGTGFGLRGMRERAHQLSGDVEVTSQPAGGTQIIFKLPIPSEVHDEG